MRKVACVWVCTVLSGLLVGGCPYDAGVQLSDPTATLDGEWRMEVIVGEYPGSEVCFTVANEIISSWRNACRDEISIRDAQAAVRVDGQVTWVFDGVTYDSDGGEIEARATLTVAQRANGVIFGTYVVNDMIGELLSYDEVELTRWQ